MTDSKTESPELIFLHDAELLLVSIDARTRTLRLNCQLEDARQVFLTMHGLTEFRCEGLSRQNIVYEVRQSHRGEFSDEDISVWRTWVLGFTDSFNETAEEQERHWLDRLRTNQIAAVCEKLALS